MNPLGPGFSIPDGPQWSRPAAEKPTVQQDRLETSQTNQTGLMKPGLVKSAPSLAQDSPRPYPAAPEDLSKGSALANLSSKTSNKAAAPLLPAGLAQCLTQLEKPPRAAEDANPTPDGWKLPANPNSTPLRPRDLFDIPVGTEDLGPLKIVASSHGRIRALRLQWPEEFQEPAFGAQKAVLIDLCTRLPQDVHFEVVAEGLAAAALPALLAEWELPAERIRIHPLHLHATPEQIYHPMTMWARDAALLLRTQDDREVLLLPRSFRGDCQVDPKLNRHVVQGTGAAPACLSRTLPELLVRRSTLGFEGGDVVASRQSALIGGEVLARNMSELKLGKEAVLELFREQFGLPVTVVAPPPEFHLDLGFTFLDDQTVAVADPDEGMRLTAHLPEMSRLIQATLDKGVTEKYQRAAQQLTAQGYRVVRLPNLCGVGLSTPYLTYNNVLLENYAGARRVYLPVYDVPPLDDRAREIYRSHGFQVVDMPSARLSTKLWGAIRCATGELRVSDT
ncbi:MAG: agmatine deiminase family protein [Candidatus Eremiobacteraeota bacterium]|nr:agmatine deiminase family protein [Candidatus Eremiobacteraeota bacterium]MCW5869341.1 agmatine deiminase family protein [Candidatus Eremiobacteraeota bacterium]